MQKILLAEDDETMVSLLKTLLKMEGYQVSALDADAVLCTVKRDLFAHGLPARFTRSAQAELLLGVEQVRIDPGNTAFTPLDFVHYPWTHSLVAVIGWSVLFALVAMLGTHPKMLVAPRYQRMVGRAVEPELF